MKQFLILRVSQILIKTQVNIIFLASAMAPQLFAGITLVSRRDAGSDLCNVTASHRSVPLQAASTQEYNHGVKA